MIAPNALMKLFERHPELRSAEASIAAGLALLSDAYRDGHFVLVCGNGGSASDSEHIVGELMKSMVRARPISVAERESLIASTPENLVAEAVYAADHLEEALPTLSLCSQTSLLSAIGNDTAEDMGFAQQVHGYGRPGDVLWALSTSGRSRNIVLAALTARAQNMSILAMTMSPGEPLGTLADVWVRVPANTVAESQELHIAIYHALCEALEEALLDLH